MRGVFFFGLLTVQQQQAVTDNKMLGQRALGRLGCLASLLLWRSDSTGESYPGE